MVMLRPPGETTRIWTEASDSHPGGSRAGQLQYRQRADQGEQAQVWPQKLLPPHPTTWEKSTSPSLRQALRAHGRMPMQEETATPLMRPGLVHPAP